MRNSVFRVPPLILCLVWWAAVSTAPAQSATNATRPSTSEAIKRIREEGLTNSQVMQTLSYLCDVIGPRLTGSPNLKRANEWTRDKMVSWGLTNAHLEAWGPFGRGWSLKRFSAQIVEPQGFPLIASPKAWTPGLPGSLTANVVYLDAKSEADLEKFKEKVKGAIVLTSSSREVKARFEAPGSRVSETELLRLANADDRGSYIAGQSSGAGSSSSSTNPIAGSGRRSSGSNNSGPSTNSNRGGLSPTRIISFLANEGAALQVSSSSQGDGGTIFVSAAATPPSAGTNRFGRSISAWATNAPPYPPQIALAVEDYNRLVRMMQAGEKLKMAVDLQTEFHDDDLMAYNTVAEIPGTDLRDEVVMLGAHMDSWHSGTGATDNGAGCAVMMEAVRILQAAQLQPRRTIRVGLWSGEEQGLLGSKAYVSSHFGYYTNITNAAANLAPKERESQSTARSTNATPRSRRELVRRREYEKLSAYFNLDNGTGKIRGVYLQGNEAVRPLFRQWLAPFRDLGAETITLSNTGGTDHQSFDAVGLPGFQFIQDPIEYWSRTHHSNADVYDRVQPEDMKQAATIVAAFAWNAATMNERLPRKPLTEERTAGGNSFPIS